MAVELQSLDAVDGTELESPRLVDERDQRGESLGGEQVGPTLFQASAPEVLGPEHPARGPSDEQRDPGVARVDSERWVLVQSIGSINTGMDVRLQTADRHGAPIGAPITLASDGRA